MLLDPMAKQIFPATPMRYGGAWYVIFIFKCLLIVQFHSFITTGTNYFVILSDIIHMYFDVSYAQSVWKIFP